MIDFDEILDDLEVKRASLLPPDELPGDRRRGCGRERSAPTASICACRDEDGSERPFAPALAGALVADALATLAAASASEPDDAGRRTSSFARPAAAVVARSAAALRGRAITAHDLSALVEAALIEQAHSRSRRRS